MDYELEDDVTYGDLVHFHVLSLRTISSPFYRRLCLAATVSQDMSMSAWSGLRTPQGKEWTEWPGRTEIRRARPSCTSRTRVFRCICWGKIHHHGCLSPTFRGAGTCSLPRDAFGSGDLVYIKFKVKGESGIPIVLYTIIHPSMQHLLFCFHQLDLHKSGFMMRTSYSGCRLGAILLCRWCN